MGLPDRRALVVMRGEVQHKNLWLIDLATGVERQLTDVPPAFNIRDFDVSPDGTQLVLERVEEDSDVVLLEMKDSGKVLTASLPRQDSVFTGLCSDP
jgi:hypothetical protein